MAHSNAKLVVLWIFGAVIIGAANIYLAMQLFGEGCLGSGVEEAFVLVLVPAIYVLATIATLMFRA